MARHRELVHRLLSYLWQGDVVGALLFLADERTKDGQEKVFNKVIGHLTARRPYIRNYEARRKAGLWIASTRVEKFNDWAVAASCKEHGMTWTYEGAGAIAAWEAARRNGELATGWQTGELPRWSVPSLPS